MNMYGTPSLLNLYPHVIKPINEDDFSISRVFACLDCHIKQSYIYIEYKLPCSCIECEGQLIAFTGESNG